MTLAAIIAGLVALLGLLWGAFSGGKKLEHARQLEGQQERIQKIQDAEEKLQATTRAAQDQAQQTRAEVLARVALERAEGPSAEDLDQQQQEAELWDEL